MTSKEITEIYNRIYKLIDRRRLKEAFALLKNTAESAMAWEYSDEISRLEQNYRYMLNYMLDGFVDPEQDKIYTGLINDSYTILDKLKRKLLERDTPTLYYNILRYTRLNKFTLADKVKQYYTELDSTDNLVGLLTSETGVQGGNLKKLEAVERDLFNYMWTVFPMTKSDKEIASELLLNTIATTQCKVLVLSAIIMSLLEFYDDEKFDLLMTAYESCGDIKLSSIALVGILLTLYKYRDKKLSMKARNHLDSLRDQPGWIPDIKIAFLELIRARDTERITKTMREEIIPGMMKIQPDIIKKIKDGNLDPDDFNSMGANPEWESILNDNGIADKIKEMSELQQDGSDVFMSTFSNLKSFPFFNDMPNWFLPFNLDRSEITEVPNELTASLGDMVQSMPFLCDSDKYSFILSLSMVPADHRKMMLSQLEENKAMQYEAMMSFERTSSNNVRRVAVNGFLQNIYRFFKLFRRKGEFYDPFKEGINLLKVKCLSDDFNDAESLRVVAEFYFKLGYWSDALEAFVKLDNVSEPEATVFEKIGYCYQMLKNIDKSIEYYHQAELFEPDNQWLISSLASAYRQQKQYDQAIGYYTKLIKQAPTNDEYINALGYCYLSAEQYDMAIKQFYNVEYNAANPKRAWRPLAWCLFLSGEYDNSLKYYSKILEDSPTSDDYMNAGHAHLALKQTKEAVQCYKQFLSKGDTTVDKFFDTLKADMVHLKKVGVTEHDIALIADSILYSI